MRKWTARFGNPRRERTTTVDIEADTEIDARRAAREVANGLGITERLTNLHPHPVSDDVGILDRAEEMALARKAAAS